MAVWSPGFPLPHNTFRDHQQIRRSNNEFGIVLFTLAKGAITLPVPIYTRGIVTFELPGAAVIATVQVVLSLALYVAYRTIFAQVVAGRRGEAADAAVESTK
jgi:2-aminoethylphosphonate transport system permease protein